MAEDKKLRLAAIWFRKTGEIDAWLWCHQEADRIGFERAMAEWHVLRASASSLAPTTLVEGVAMIMKKDPLPVEIVRIAAYGEAGVSVMYANRETDRLGNQNYQTSAEVVADLDTYFSLEAYEFVQRNRLAAQEQADIAAAAMPRQVH